MTTKEIIERIEAFTGFELPRLRKLSRYYKGDHDILRGIKEPGKPDNRLVNNFCRSITDSTVGYFMGQPIGYSMADEKSEALLTAVNSYNDESFANGALARDLSVYGRACELLWYDGDHQPRFTPLDVQTVIPVYDGTLENELSAAIRFYSDDAGEGKTTVEVYSPTSVTTYLLTSAKNLEWCSEVPHFFGMVPVNFYYNNRAAEGDFEGVITLVDAYNTLQSESVNDFELFADSYLAISGMGGTTREDIERLRRDRVLLLDEGGDAKWLTKTVNDAYIENLKTRIASDIYRFSSTVDMSENSLAGADLSGVAIRWRMLNFDNRVKTTEHYFRRGIMRRWELITNLLTTLGYDFDYRPLKLNFTRNIPGNVEDAADTAVKLNGIVSKRTIFEQLPFVSSPEEELDRLREEGADSDE